MGTRKGAFERMTVDERRQTIARMYVQGHVQWSIGKVLGVSQTTVCQDLEVIRKQWLEANVQTYDEKIAREVVGLELLESQLWEAWYNSCKQDIVSTISRKKVLPKKRATKKRKNEDETTTSSNERHDDFQTDKDGLMVVEEQEKIVTRQMYGDPRFANEIKNVKELKCKLLGLLEDRPIEPMIVNIWEQLQQASFKRDHDEIEERLKMIEGPLDSQPLDTSGLAPPSSNGDE